jgi:hypothetical protein
MTVTCPCLLTLWRLGQGSSFIRAAWRLLVEHRGFFDIFTQKVVQQAWSNLTSEMMQAALLGKSNRTD